MKITKENKEIINELFKDINADEIKFIYNSSKNLCSQLIELDEKNTIKLVTDISPFNPILKIKEGLLDLFINKGSYIDTSLNDENNILLTGKKVQSLEHIDTSSISQKIKIRKDIESDLIKNFGNIFIFSSSQKEIQKIIEASNINSQIFIITNFISNEIYWETDKRNISFIEQKNISLRHIFGKIIEIVNQPLRPNTKNEITRFFDLNSIYKKNKSTTGEFFVKRRNNDHKDEKFKFANMLNKKFQFNQILDNNFFGNIKKLIKDFEDNNNIDIFIRCVDERLVSSDKRKILFLYYYIFWMSQIRNKGNCTIDIEYFGKTFRNKYSYIESNSQVTLKSINELFIKREGAKDTINKRLYHSFRVMIPQLLSSPSEIDNYIKLNEIKVSHFLNIKKPDQLQVLSSVFNTIHDIEKRTSPFLNQIYFLINITQLDKFNNINLTNNKLFSFLLHLKSPSINLQYDLSELYSGTFDNISFQSKPFAFLTYSILKERFGIAEISKNNDLSPDFLFDHFTKRICNTDNKLLYSPLHCSFLLDYYRRNDLSEFFELTESMFKNYYYDYESINFYNNLISSSS